MVDSFIDCSFPLWGIWKILEAIEKENSDYLKQTNKKPHNTTLLSLILTGFLVLRYKTSVVIDGNSEALLSHPHVFEAGMNYLLDLTVISYIVQEVWQSSGEWALLC